MNTLLATSPNRRRNQSRHWDKGIIQSDEMVAVCVTFIRIPASRTFISKVVFQ